MNMLSTFMSREMSIYLTQSNKYKDTCELNIYTHVHK